MRSKSHVIYGKGGKTVLIIPVKMLRLMIFRATEETTALLDDIHYNLTNYVFTVDMFYYVMSLQIYTSRAYF